MNLTTRILKESDIQAVKQLDILSDRNVSNWLDSEEYAWGIFNEDTLIGYCTIGYADDVSDIIQNYPGWNDDCLLLSDVFVSNQFRNKGIATKMINDALNKHSEVKNNIVFLEAITMGLQYLYRKIGFNPIKKDYTMVKDYRRKVI